MIFPPNFNELPPAIRSAELRAGNLAVCGPGVRGVGWPETAMIRAQAVAALLPDTELTVASYTAAWVWGASWPNAPFCVFSTLHGRRYLRRRTAGTDVRELFITDNQVVVLGSVQVTNFERTLYDLLYLGQDEYETFGLTAAREMCDLHGSIDASIVTQFHRRNRPYRKQAEERLRLLLSLTH